MLGVGNNGGWGNGKSVLSTQQPTMSTPTWENKQVVKPLQSPEVKRPGIIDLDTDGTVRKPTKPTKPSDSAIKAAENVKQYFLDKANMDVKEFLGKYPYGEQQLKKWYDEIASESGTEAAGQHFTNWKRVGEAKQRENVESAKEGGGGSAGSWGSTSDSQSNEKDIYEAGAQRRRTNVNKAGIPEGHMYAYTGGVTQTPAGGGGVNEMQFAANTIPMHVGLNGDEEGTPPEPSPTPAPGPPPPAINYEALNSLTYKFPEEALTYGNYISEKDYKQYLREIEQYKNELIENGGEWYDSSKINDATKALEILEQNWAFSQEADQLKNNNSAFNTNGIISAQSTLGTESYGSQGNAADNACGAVAAHNALVLLGDNSDFAEAYAYFNDDSKLNLGWLLGGKWGTKPEAVMDYLEQQGHKTKSLDFKTEVFETPGTYIMVYGWQSGSTISAHFKAAQSDGSTVQTYNSDNTYYIGNKNNSGDSNAKKIEEIKSDSRMLTIEKSWLLSVAEYMLNPVEFFSMLLSGDDTYFSYIIKVD